MKGSFEFLLLLHWKVHCVRFVFVFDLVVVKRTSLCYGLLYTDSSIFFCLSLLREVVTASKLLSLRFTFRHNVPNIF